MEKKKQKLFVSNFFIDIKLFQKKINICRKCRRTLRSLRSLINKVMGCAITCGKN